MVDATEDSTNREWVELGGRLRHAREYLSLSQQDVAASTGIPRSAISDIERGQRKVDSLELRKLAKVYRRPVSSLLGDEVAEAAAGSGSANDLAADSVVALARAVQGLTDADKAEVARFAEFLRFQAGARGVAGGGDDGVR